MRITKQRIRNKVNRYFPVFGKIEDADLNRITCIRHTITWRCNYQCTSCDIWKIEKPRYSGKPSRVHEEATPQDIDNMCKSPLLRDVTEVIISGGEPTLRNDFVELLSAYHYNLPKAHFGITINGYDPDRAYRFFKELHKRGLKWNVIGVSLNGDIETHNRSRGRKCWHEVVETAKILREFSNNVAFSFTFLEDNVEQFDYVKSLGRMHGINTHVCWTVMNKRFVATKKDLVFQDNPELVPVLERYVGANNIKMNCSAEKDFIRYKQNIKGAYLYDSILNQRVMPCHAARTFFHLDPYGDVYPCNFDLRPERVMGNIKTDTIEEIWNKRKMSMLAAIKRGDCMYPNGSLCGDSDINRSIRQKDTTVLEWYKGKKKNGEKLIQINRSL